MHFYIKYMLKNCNTIASKDDYTIYWDNEKFDACRKNKKHWKNSRKSLLTAIADIRRLHEKYVRIFLRAYADAGSVEKRCLIFQQQMSAISLSKHFLLFSAIFSIFLQTFFIQYLWFIFHNIWNKSLLYCLKNVVIKK